MKNRNYPAPNRAKETAWRDFVASVMNLADHMNDADAAMLFDLRMQAERVFTKTKDDSVRRADLATSHIEYPLCRAQEVKIRVSSLREVQFNPDQKRGQRDIENATDKSDEPKRL